MAAGTEVAVADRISVLLVDDEPLVLSSLRRCLRSAASDIRVASSADQALSLVDAEVPDLVISDFRMPGSMTGLDLLEHIQAGHPRVHCVLHTAEHLPDSERRGRFEVISKPCSNQVLLDLIETVRSAHHGQE